MTGSATESTAPPTPPRTVEESSIGTETKEERFEKWAQAIHEYVSNDLFAYIQFVNREEVVNYGSGIQKIVCKECRIPENDRLEFWTNIGMDRVEEVMRRKRQTIATCFRSQFMSK